MYTIKLPNFEGPLDLLLFFIKRDELDIYDIPIARITKDFLQYVRLMQLFDLELAGEFLVMASTLMQVKAKMLLPKEVNEQGEEIQGDDPRKELVQQLLQYSQYKEVSSELAHKAEQERYVFYRKLFEQDAKQSETEPYKNATLFDLLRAMKRALERKPAAPPIEHVITLNPITVEEQSEHIRTLLTKEKRIFFFDVIKELPRIHVVVTFLAVLELAKNQFVVIRQNELFDDIEIAEPTTGLAVNANGEVITVNANGEEQAPTAS